MSYTTFTSGNCDCPGDDIIPIVAQCTTCNASGENAQLAQDINQRRQWGLVRTSSSMYVSNLSAMTVRGGPNNDPKAIYGGVNWNQMSDRAVPSLIPSTMNVPRNRTRHRPGASGSGGVNASGVDVKHDSYARYLARKKAKNLKSIVNDPLPAPMYGNKQYSLGLIPECAVICTTSSSQ